MQTPPKILTPLGIIFLFVALAEAVLGVGITRTSSWIQGLLATFACVFPTGVACAFFYILYHRPENFYAPKDFGGDASYLETMKEARAIRVQRFSAATVDLQTKIEKEVRSAALRPELSDPTLREQVAAEEVQRIKKEVGGAFIVVDLSEIDESVGEVTLPVSAYDSLNDLTDDLFVMMRDKVRPFAYGYDWVLRHAESKVIIVSRRMIEKIPVGKPAIDGRALKEVGIVGGDALEVIRPSMRNRQA